MVVNPRRSLFYDLLLWRNRKTKKSNVHVDHEVEA